VFYENREVFIDEPYHVGPGTPHLFVVRSATNNANLLFLALLHLDIWFWQNDGVINDPHNKCITSKYDLDTGSGHKDEKELIESEKRTVEVLRVFLWP